MQALPRPSFFQAIKNVMIKYAKFSGRSRRSEFWYFKLLLFILYFLIAITQAFDNNKYVIEYIENNSTDYNITNNLTEISNITDEIEEVVKNDPANIFAIISAIIGIIFFIPNLTVTVRRLHDVGRTGWYVLIPIIPVIGYLILLYFCICDSEEQANQYGPSPKYVLPKESFLNLYPQQYPTEELDNLNEQFPQQKYGPIQMNDLPQ
jgi:uncharacterized membrane protein YhaH (DUF805 family)